MYQTNTQQSGFLQLLEPGDTVLADRGFDISDDIGVHGGKLTIPAFHKVNQLTQKEVEFSQRLAVLGSSVATSITTAGVRSLVFLFTGLASQQLR